MSNPQLFRSKFQTSHRFFTINILLCICKNQGSFKITMPIITHLNLNNCLLISSSDIRRHATSGCLSIVKLVVIDSHGLGPFFHWWLQNAGVLIWLFLHGWARILLVQSLVSVPQSSLHRVAAYAPLYGCAQSPTDVHLGWFSKTAPSNILPALTQKPLFVRLFIFNTNLQVMNISVLILSGPCAFLRLQGH